MEEEISKGKAHRLPEEEDDNPPEHKYRGGIKITTSYVKPPSGFWGFPMEQEHISIVYRRKRR